MIMPDILPTVKIINPDNADDYIIINESDFNPSFHQIYQPKSKVKIKKIQPLENSEGDNDN